MKIMTYDHQRARSNIPFRLSFRTNSLLIIVRCSYCPLICPIVDSISLPSPFSIRLNGS